MREKRRRAWASLAAAAGFLPAGAAAVGLATAVSGPDPDHAVLRGAGPLFLAKGGEANVDTRRAGDDPVVFLTALDVMAAQYHAGIAAYLAGDHGTAAEMFAHPLSRVYRELRRANWKLGVTDFRKEMEQASALALANAPDAEVKAAANAVFSAIAKAATKAPKSARSAHEVQSAVLGDMLNRAALQYQRAMLSQDYEPYLDGFGYFAAARERARELAPKLSAEHAEAHAAVNEALAVLADAYSGIRRPAAAAVPAGDVLAVVSKALLALTQSRT